jgi:hypothetical protein
MNGRWGGLYHNTDYGKEGGPLFILLLSFSSKEGKRKDIARKVNVKKKKRPLK